MVFKKICCFSFIFLVALQLHSQDAAPAISAVDKALGSKAKTISDILSDNALMHLHSMTPFRELIKKYANTESITVVNSTEPGVRIVVNGTVTNSQGKPLANILLYFYHTSDKGWYSDTGVHIREVEGDYRHSRLFGYIRTDANGKFTIKTIRPNGYPQSDFAGHIHIQLWKADGTHLARMPGELQFDDDVRMTAQRRQRSIAEGYLVAKNEGTKEKPVYNYTIRSKVE
jgi:protocatechuate 3,4-dioxygenase beta subunit